MTREDYVTKFPRLAEIVRKPDDVLLKQLEAVPTEEAALSFVASNGAAVTKFERMKVVYTLYPDRLESVQGRQGDHLRVIVQCSKVSEAARRCNITSGYVNALCETYARRLTSSKRYLFQVLSERAYNIVSRQGISTVEELVTAYNEDRFSTKHAGVCVLEELFVFLKEQGFEVKTPDEIMAARRNREVASEHKQTATRDNSSFGYGLTSRTLSVLKHEGVQDDDSLYLLYKTGLIYDVRGAGELTVRDICAYLTSRRYTVPDVETLKKRKQRGTTDVSSPGRFIEPDMTDPLCGLREVVQRYPYLMEAIPGVYSTLVMIFNNPSVTYATLNVIGCTPDTTRRWCSKLVGLMSGMYSVLTERFRGLDSSIVSTCLQHSIFDLGMLKLTYSVDLEHPDIAVFDKDTLPVILSFLQEKGVM